MNLNLKKAKGLGLCSGGLDSMLSALVLKEQGIEVFWVAFETPFFSAEKARKASDQTGVPLTVVDITDRYLPMLKNPPGGYGKHMNPCMDCHALMFRIAGEIMIGKGYDFLFSGEVMGQRPMSQTKNSLRYVEKRSGFDGYILRPLSAKLLPETIVEKRGLVDRERLLDFSGRSRKPQMELAKKFGITDYPMPAGGCLLTDKNFSSRLQDLFGHQADWAKEELNLLKYGRHLRLDHTAKIVIGRNQMDNEKIISCHRPGKDILITMNHFPGPIGVIPNGCSETMLSQAASVCAGYSKAPKDKPVGTCVTLSTGTLILMVMPMPHAEIKNILIL
jgi:tRNA U34 2-thiouridine synthase MnmA/TrmU